MSVLNTARSRERKEMAERTVDVGDIRIGGDNPLVLIAGPCVIESADNVKNCAREIKKITAGFGMPFIFKASFDKANRSSIRSYRGPGLMEGLKILDAVRKETGVPVLSDIHCVSQIEEASRVLDVIQIPAFLCRQTDLIFKAASTGKPVNVKKGQFMSPEEMTNVVSKIESAGNHKILLTERGTSFGYNTLVNDFRSLVIMGRTGYPVVYDATHSVQMPGGMGSSSGGDSTFALPLTKAAVAVGCDAIFLEVHESPEKAKSDGPNMIKLADLGDFLEEVLKIDKARRKR